jgi:hypothetical protein
MLVSDDLVFTGVALLERFKLSIRCLEPASHPA